MLAIVAALIVGIAVFFMVHTIQDSAEKNAAEDRLGINWSSPDKAAFKAPFYIALTKPLLKGPYLDLATGYWKAEALAKWKAKLISAGLGRYIEPEHFVAAKFWMTFYIAAVLLFLKAFSSDPPSSITILVATAFMFFLPNLHLDSLRKVRQQNIRIAMPYVVDLLTLSIEAGLDFMGAIGRVVEKAPSSPLVEELSILLKDIQLGKTRAQALRAMADRIDMHEMSSFVAILISSDQMGAPIGNVLRAQSDSMRNERLAKAEKMGAQASQKILIPLIFFIMPAVFLIIFGPFVIQMIQGGGN
jgi:tight adherence protein C